MSTAHDRAAPGLIQRLLDAPHTFEFVQAVHLLVQWFGAQGVDEQRALGQFVHFDNSLALTFAPSQIEALRAYGPDPLTSAAQLVPALQAGTLEIHLTPTFMGLLGASGTLPPHYTERIFAHLVTHKDDGPRAFLDLFSSRALALFYQASRHWRFDVAMADDNDALLPMLLALGGARHRGGYTMQPATRCTPPVAVVPTAEVPAVLNAPGIDEDLLAFYAGLLRQRGGAVSMMNSILSAYFGVPVALEQRVGCWDRKAPQEQSALGLAHVTLGDDAMLGERAWRPDLRARIRIGPLTCADYAAFLPGGADAIALDALLSLFGEPTVTYEVMPMLAAEEVMQIQLAPEPVLGVRLGFDAFLVTQANSRTRDDLRYDVVPMAPLPPICAFP